MVCETYNFLLPLLNIPVLILVLMEYGLRVGGQTAVKAVVNGGLNPCFNGIWSASGTLTAELKQVINVLILVLMEYGLRGSNL